MLFENIGTLIPRRVIETLRSIDWILLIASIIIAVAGMVTMYSFRDDSSFFTRHAMWLVVSVGVFSISALFDFRFLRRTGVVVVLYVLIVTLLGLLFVVGSTFQGAKSWFSFAGFSIQPVEPAKVVLIIILAKYFARRHIEIARIRHILVSGLYAFILFVLIFLQPDFGSAIILFLIWLGMILVAGISKRHLILLFLIGAVSFAGLWSFALEDYQKNRITSFLDPYTDIQGVGYNAYQSMVAVGSGGMFGKGVGYGTQSKLSFLPEYQTDFIFAAFSEEWGFVGAIVLLVLYGIVFWRIIVYARRGATTFETLYALGVVVYFMSHVFVHIGMNISLLPVTGVTIPFMSHGGTHLATEFLALGILTGMGRYRRVTHIHHSQEIDGVH